MSDLTFGIKLTADGKQLVGEVRASREEFDKLGTSVQRAAGRMASDYSGLNKTVKEHAAAVTDTDGKVGKLLDRYDPLGAKLRQLQADFKALDAAASTGKIAGRDDARVDAVYVRLQREINAASAATGSFGEASGKAARSAGQLRMATQQLPMQFTDIWVSLAAGQSPMMVMLQQGTQIKDLFGGIGGAAGAMGRYMLGLVNPITLVTAALAAGAYAWYKYENVAVESAEKTMAAIRKALGEERRVASMGKDALDDEIKYTEGLIKTDQAYASQLEANKTRFNWKASHAELVKYNAAIKENTTYLDNLKAARAGVGDGVDKLREQSTYARRESLTKEIALLETYNGKQQAGTREYLSSLSAITDKKKQLADLQKPEKAGRVKIDPNDTAVASLQAEQFRKEMDMLGVSAEQITVYELAMRGATDTHIRDAQAAADAIAPLNAELEARKKLQKQVKDAAKGGAILGRLGGDFDAESSKKNRALNDATMSAADKQHADNLDTVAQRAAKAREDLAKLGITEEARAQLLVSVAQVEAEQIRRMEELRQQVEKNNASWEYGANVALRNYRDEAANVAKQSESLFTRGFKSMEDAVTRFAMTGKLSIRDFASTVIEEFYRINVSRPLVSAGSSLLQSAMGAIGGYFGGSTAGASASTVASFGATPTAAGTTDYMALAGFRADGGPVDSNSLYRVNEKVPEVFSSGGNDYLMTGGRGGFVTPLAQAKPAQGDGQSQPITLVYSPSIAIDARNATPGMEQTLARVVNQAVEQTRAVLLAELSAGGQFALATGRRR